MPINHELEIEQDSEEQVLNNKAQELLRQLQIAAESKTFGPLHDAQNDFIDFLRSLPLAYKSLRLTLILSRKDTKQQNLDQFKGCLDIIPKSSICSLLILVPRRPPTDDIKAAHGSPVRERFFSIGEINNIRFEQVAGTKYLIINPASIGTFSMDRSFGVYPLTPKEIQKIEVVKDLPKYLKPEQRNWVNGFYDQLSYYQTSKK
jgi:hypothetical protein